MTKITLDSISRADLHKLVIDLQKRVDKLESDAIDTRNEILEMRYGKTIDRLIDEFEHLEERVDELDDRVDQWIIEESVDEREFKKMLFKFAATESGINRNRAALVAFAEVMERNSDKPIEEYAEIIKKVYPQILEDIDEGVYK